MKVPKTFVPENNERLEEKAKNYLNKVEYVQKPYDEEELGIGATATLPEEFARRFDIITLDPKLQNLKKRLRNLYINTADTLSKAKDLSVEELEKKLLEDYTTLP